VPQGRRLAQGLSGQESVDPLRDRAVEVGGDQGAREPGLGAGRLGREVAPRLGEEAGGAALRMDPQSE